MNKRVKLDKTMTNCPHLQSLDIKPPTSSQHVYKDECCHCFFSQDSDLGIDVCLSCFQAGCLEPGREHAIGHYKLFPEHTLVLNIRRQEVIKPTEVPDLSTVTKLSIKAESDSEKYIFNTEVKCLACQVTFDNPVPELESTISAVMTALSSTQQSEVKAWEQEMIACEHTLMLQQESARILEDQTLAMCSKCDLKENLWLCLVCGTLSCGRAQFGGGGGNGHGLEHVANTSHALAVKLGSITPEGTADVYCYTCNEERVDPLLQDHLAHWGINLTGRTKTERSLQELQIEQNMKWEFSMTTEDGKEMIPLFGPEFTGMTNIGNSCYLASIMQAVFSLSQFSARFYGSFQQEPTAVVANPADDLEAQMRKLADGLLSGNFSQPLLQAEDEIPHQSGISPSMFKALIGKDHSEFSTMRQQDAFEFLLYLVEKLNRVQHLREIPNPTSAFQFQVEQRTQCLECLRVAYRAETQDNLSIQVPARKSNSDASDKDDRYEDITIKELLDSFTASETVQYTCAACNSSTGASKQTLFKTFPEVFVLNPGRFILENWVPRKIEIPVIVPEEGFSLDDYLSKGHQQDEELLPDENTATTEAVDEAELEQLMAMGFPRVRAEKALLTTKSGPEPAMEWLFAHMDDADIDEPYQPPSSSNVAAQANPGIIDSLVEMGFPRPRCEKAAVATTNAGVEAAMEWLVMHMDDSDIDEPVSHLPDPPSEQAKAAGSAALGGRYRTKAMVCHKGSSIHAGHYVAFIKKKVEGQDDWVLYNDEKVLRGVDSIEASKTAYVYFFERSI